MVPDSVTLIECQGLGKTFRDGKRAVRILQDVSLGVREGEMVAIMGRSGAGKSTLLSCLAGLDDPDTGSVRLLGTELSSLSLTKRAKLRRTHIGFVFQQYQLVPYLSAAQNVALPLRLAHRRIADAQIRELLGAVGMADYARERTSDLSGGEQQRVALARALAQQPRILMADEPTGALDTAIVATVMQLLRGCAQHGCVLIVTHDPLVAAQCDRILMLRDGRIVQQLQTNDVIVVSQALASVVGA